MCSKKDSPMIGMLPEYTPPPMMYCTEKEVYCNAYRDDPCYDCPIEEDEDE